MNKVLSGLSFACASAIVATPALSQCANGSPPPCISRGPVDTNAYVILPFTVRGPQDMQYLRESIMDLLHMALDGVGRISVRDQQVTMRRLDPLAENSEAGASAPIARGLGAGRIIGGTAVVAGSQLRLQVQVYDVERSQLQVTLSARGTVAAVGETVDGLAASLLARKLVAANQKTRVDLSEYATRSPAALQSFLIGMQHVRRGQRRIAADSMRSALKSDPSFGLAHQWLASIEGAQFGSSGVQGGLATILQQARAYEDSFPERVRVMLSILQAYQLGQRDRALMLAENAVKRWPNDADAAFQLADKYFHVGLNRGVTREQLLKAFGAAFQLDDENLELTAHYAGLMLEFGDTARAFAAVRRCKAISPAACNDDVASVLYLGARPWAAERPADSVSNPQMFVLRSTPDLARGVAITDSFFLRQTQAGRPGGAQFTGYYHRAFLEMMRGRFGLAQALSDSAADDPAGTAGQNAQAVQISILSNVETPAVRKALLRMRGENMPGRAVRALYGAVFEAPDSAESRIVPLEHVPWFDSTMGASIATGLRGLVSLRRGDTAQGLALLSNASVNSNRRITARYLLPGPYFSLVAARVLATRGDYKAAMAFVDDFYPAPDVVPWVTEMEEVRGKVMLALGDTAAARAAYRNVVELWKDADPVLQPRLSAARAILALLERR